MRIKIKGIKINIDRYFFAVVLLLLPFGYAAKFLVFMLSIFAHEMGHAAFAVLKGKKINSIDILPVGLKADIQDEADAGSVWAGIYFAGPVTNAVLAAAAYFASKLSGTGREGFDYFVSVNLYLAVFNLIPVIPLDGGRLLALLLAPRIGILSAGRAIRRISLWLALVILLTGALQLAYSRFNFSLVLIGAYLIFSYRTGNSEAAVMNMKNIFFRRTRLLRRGIYPGRDIVVLRSFKLNEVLSFMDYDRFHFIHVLDDELKLMRIFTEQEIIDAMVGGKNEMTFAELIEKVHHV